MRTIIKGELLVFVGGAGKVILGRESIWQSKTTWIDLQNCKLFDMAGAKNKLGRNMLVRRILAKH